MCATFSAQNIQQIAIQCRRISSHWFSSVQPGPNYQRYWTGPGPSVVGPYSRHCKISQCFPQSLQSDRTQAAVTRIIMKILSQMYLQTLHWLSNSGSWQGTHSFIPFNCVLNRPNPVLRWGMGKLPPPQTWALPPKSLVTAVVCSSKTSNKL